MNAKISPCLLSALMSTLFTGVLAQQNYSDFSPINKTALFADSFNNNSNKWLTANDYLSGKVENGNYDLWCKTFNESTSLSFHPVSIEPNKDYEIEANIKILKGSGSLVFGITDKLDHYAIELNDNNLLCVKRNLVSRQKIEKLSSLPDLPSVKKGDLNKITLRKFGSVYYLFVNEKLAGQFTNILPKGNQVGFKVGFESEIIIDDLTVSYLTAQFPSINWQSPVTNNTSTDSANYLVRAELKSSVGLISATLWINGTEKPLIDKLTDVPSSNGTKALEHKIMLKQGENDIMIIASNIAGTTISEKRQIYYKPVLASRDITNQPSQTNANVIPKNITPEISSIPPTITWLSPVLLTSNVSCDTLAIRAKIKTEAKLEYTRITVNGVALVDRTAFIPGPENHGEYILERTLSLKPGVNILSIEASTSGTISSSEQRLINYQVIAAPVIKWDVPDAEVPRVKTGNVAIRATIQSSVNLESALLYVNGASTTEPGFRISPNANGDYVMERRIDLKQGDNSVYIVATNESGSTKSELRYFVNQAATPPIINWGKPATNNSIVADENFTIDACIQSGTNLQSTQIFVNGIQQASDMIFQPNNNSDCNFSLQRIVILKEGENSIFIIATNMAGSATSEKRLIKLETALTEKRLALVLGNSNYGEKSLKNPVNDANLMESTLKSLGFDVIKRTNATKIEMENAIKEFSKRLPDYNVGLFYYAGHGIQVDGMNYLIPVDAVMKEKTDCKWEAVAVNYLVEEFEKYPDNTNIVILDACRDNPYRGWVRGGESGFKAITPTSGTIISFATSEGAVAADGDGANGLFTEELVKQMVVPQPVESVFKKTRFQVQNRSHGVQSPQEWSKLIGDFYFKK
jgi:hypothetical protein